MRPPLLRAFRLRLAANLRSPPVPLSPCLLVLFLLFFRLGARDLVSSHEARAAQNAQRMLDTGEWDLPVLFDCQADLQKPPGFYWLVAAAGWLNGGRVTPLVARLPAALGGLAVVLLIYAFLRREGWKTGALVAAVALASANHFVAIARTARIDVPLTCAVAVALVAFYRGCVLSVERGHLGRRSLPSYRCEDDPKQTERDTSCGRDARAPQSQNLPWHLLSALAAGFTVLLKGPVGLALIGTTAVAFLIVERFAAPASERPRLPLLAAVLGVLVVAAVALPWFVWTNHATGGEFVRVFFWHHNVGRFAGTEESLATHPWWFYGPRFAFAFLPWTLLLVPLVTWAVRSGAWKEDRLFRFGVVWLVVMVAVLSASRFKRADYLLPAFPGAAIALGCTAERWLATRTNPRSVKRARWAFGLSLAGGLAVWPVMWFAVEPAEAARQEKRPFAEAVRSAAPAPRTILLFRAESHLLAYHLGPPLHTLVEWGELKAALAAPGPHAVVMPPEYAADAERITGRRLVPVATLAEFTTVAPHRPLVCLRTAD
jgi:4-amino-4-deoxy-L-arabinose transferase-like glycosyltransferase